MTVAGDGIPALTLVSHHLCPYVQRAAIALAEKGVSFERRQVDLAAKPEWFRAISPLGKVPLLIVRQEDGCEVVLFESAAICEFLEETQPGPALHPRDALARARHRGWMELGSAILADLWGFETAKDEASFIVKRGALAGKFARVEAELGDGPFFAGRDFSLVDAVFAPIFRYFDVFDALMPASLFDTFPKIAAWRKVLRERESIRKAVGDDYVARLGDFLRDHDAWLLKMAT